MRSKEFHEALVRKMDAYAHFVYRVTQKFPKHELFGVTSQLRRAALSVILNYIEGYARRRPAVMLNFFETAYGSLKESKYLLYFSSKEGYCSEKEYQNGLAMAEEIGAMLWTKIESLAKSIQ